MKATLIKEINDPRRVENPEMTFPTLRKGTRLEVNILDKVPGLVGPFYRVTVPSLFAPFNQVEILMQACDYMLHWNSPSKEAYEATKAKESPARQALWPEWENLTIESRERWENNHNPRPGHTQGTAHEYDYDKFTKGS
jgi:hypothetical protein